MRTTVLSEMSTGMDVGLRVRGARWWTSSRYRVMSSSPSGAVSPSNSRMRCWTRLTSMGLSRPVREVLRAAVCAG